MTLKLSKTALRELTRLYRGILVIGLTLTVFSAQTAMATITEGDLANYTLKTATNEQTNQIATVDAITEEMAALIAQKEANISGTLGFDVSNNPANTEVPNSLVSKLTGEIAGDETSVVGAINALDSAVAQKANSADVYTKDEVNTLFNTVGGIGSTQIANDAVTADKIADDAVGQNHIANGAVGTAEIKNESITKTKLDSSLQASINQVDTNKTAIETLNGDANTVGSVANTVNTAVNTLATGAVQDNTNAIAILNGNASTEGSVAKTVADAVSTKQDTLSANQMNAVNSGITADKVATYDAYAAKIEAVQTSKANTDDVYTKDTVDAKLTAKADATTVATNTANITNNSNAIAQNAQNITANADKIAENTADIAALQAGKANIADVYTKTEINTQIADTKTYAEDKAVAAETNAKAYTDNLATGTVATNTANITTNANNIATNANAIATNKTAIEVLNGDSSVTGSVAQQVDNALTQSKSYTDTQIVDTKTYAEEKANTAETNAKSYADTQDSIILDSAKSYTDTLIGTTDVLVEQNGVIKLGTVNNNIAALNNTIGDITDLNQYTEGATIGNALTQGGTQSADTVVAALNNIDATLGTIHGLRDKLATSGGGTNLASGTTVEQHLTALDSAIGNRAYTSTRYISSGSDLSSAVSTLDSNLSRVEGNLDALTRRTQKMHHEMKSGFASLAAMSALVPNARVAGDTQISVGTGHYRGTTGFALGAFHHVNDNVLLNAGAAYGGNGSATFKGGITFGW